MFDYFDDLVIDTARIKRNLAWFFGALGATLAVGFASMWMGWI